jgi:hypothetical protein
MISICLFKQNYVFNVHMFCLIIVITITIFLCSGQIAFLRVFTYDAEDNYHLVFSASTENYFPIVTNVVVDSYARKLI